MFLHRKYCGSTQSLRSRPVARQRKRQADGFLFVLDTECANERATLYRDTRWGATWRAMFVGTCSNFRLALQSRIITLMVEWSGATNCMEWSRLNKDQRCGGICSALQGG